jgi:DNA-binding PadR family transcriptional regulator
MERRGWLASEWAVTEKNRRAKYYQLTKTGREQLHAEDAQWRRYVAVVGKVLAAAKS